MTSLDTQRILNKYLPSKSKFFKHCGLACLASLIVGIGYGYFLMEFSVELTQEEESTLRLGLGVYLSFVLMLVSTVILSIIYWVKVFQAKKRAKAEITGQYVDKK